jgi:uncharacterized protein
VSVELRPLGVACNLACDYCYQQPQRDAGNQKMSYDLERMKTAASRSREPFVLFGGEPLLMRFEDLEDLFAWGFARSGGSSIQTNGVLIEDRHIDLFRRYKVSVGLSIDGPGELNDARAHHVRERTREATAKVEKTILRLCREYQPPGLIVTLHRGNATAEKLPVMMDWLRQLHAAGIRSMRLHLLEIDHASVRDRLALSARENVAALLAFARLRQDLPGLRIDVFDEMERLLAGNDSGATCVWRGCDPYTTEAVQGVEGNGRSSNCGRTDKEGVGFIKASQAGYERYIALYRTPHAENGCAGCRFFLMCKGQCPGTSIGGDWRNRTEHCEVWFQLFTLIERRMLESGKTPLSTAAHRQEAEQRLVQAWMDGRYVPVHRILRDMKIGAAGGNTSGVSRRAAGIRSKVRLSWVSEKARDCWGPRLSLLPRALAEMTAHRGAGPSGLCHVRLVGGRSLHGLMARAAQNGAGAAILPATALPEGICTEPAEGLTRVFLAGAPSAVARARTAWEKQDLAAFHAVLDLPPCCLAMARRRADGTAADEHLVMAEVPETISLHALLAPLGISVLPIEPCRVDCPAALEWGARSLAAAAANGFAEEVNWLRECMGWALSWSELHGVTEVKTPMFKMCFLSTPRPQPRTFRRPGVTAAEGSVAGLSFPYAVPSRQTALVQIQGAM